MTIAETAAPAAADEHDRVKKTKSRRKGGAARDGCARRALHLFLAVTLGIDAIIVLCLAVRDFMLTWAILDTVGSAVLLAIGIVCTWAFVAVCRCYSTWLPTTLASQTGVALLAGYVWLTDQRSPTGQLLGVTGVALVIGAIAIFWIFRLARYAKAPLVKGIGAALAILPIVSLVQFWMQSDYLPRTSRPMVDIETELSPIGTSGRTIHVLAKVTMHNRGSVQADVIGTLMRVTAYPKGSPQQPDRSHTVADAIDLTGWTSGDFRAVPTSPARSQLLYADNVATLGEFLAPGETASYKRLIDIDADAVGLTRLSVKAVFLTKRQLADMRSCSGQRISSTKDQSEFWRQANPSQEIPGGGHLRCVEIEIAPAGVVQELVSDHQVLRVLALTDVPDDPDSEYPQMEIDADVRQSDGDLANIRNRMDMLRKIDNANPTTTYSDMTEYSPTDKDLQGDTPDAKR